MSRLPSLAARLSRLRYRLAVFTGLRAAGNRLRAQGSRRPVGAELLDASTLHVRRLGTMALAVHARPRPTGQPTSRTFGMLSARLVEPPVHPLLYAYLCATSHFGRAHFEVAFYEEDGAWTIHGVRDIARGSAARLGWRATAAWLPGARAADELLGAVVRHLRAHGRTVQLADPLDCVRLSVRPELVPLRERARLSRTLRARYERLSVRLAAAERDGGSPDGLQLSRSLE